MYYFIFYLFCGINKKCCSCCCFCCCCRVRAKNGPSREVVSRSLHHSPASLIFLLLLQLGVARTWKELFIAKGTLATQASNNEVTTGAIIWDGDRKSWDARGPMIWDNFSIFRTNCAILTSYIRANPRTCRGFSRGCCHVAGSNVESC